MNNFKKVLIAFHVFAPIGILLGSIPATSLYKKWGLDQIIEWDRTVEQSLQEAKNQIPIVKLELFLILGTSTVAYNVVTTGALSLFHGPESEH